MKKWVFVAFVLAFVMVGILGIGSDSVDAKKSDPIPQYEEIVDPEQRLYFRTAIAPPDGTDAVYYWDGSVFMSIPGDIYAPPYPGAPGDFYPHGGGNGGTPLFGFEGYNIRRVVPYIDPETGVESETDFILATREIVFYKDPATGEVLDIWTNPLTGKTTPVVPVLNEYLFSRFRVEDGILNAVIPVNFAVAPGVCRSIEIVSPVASPREWGNNYTWVADIFPNYKLNDCGRWGIDDSMNLKAGKYSSSEMFDFYAPKFEIFRIAHEMRSGKVRDWVPNATLSWTRTGPTLPWMCQSEETVEARLIYHARSEMVDDWDDMPADFQDKMYAYDYPWGGLGLDGWQEAPTEYIPGYSNDTSWSIMNDKVLEPAGQDWATWCASFE